MTVTLVLNNEPLLVRLLATLLNAVPIGGGDGEDDAATLLRRSRDGDANAFVRLIYTHRRSLRTLAYGIVADAATLDDVMQEAFIKAFRSLDSLREGASFKAWIHRIVYTTAIDEVRKRQRVTPMAPHEMWDDARACPSS